jgi:hypothetical protein
MFAVHQKDKYKYFNKGSNSALDSAQQNFYAMSMLRSRVESQINFIVKKKGNNDRYQDL